MQKQNAGSSMYECVGLGFEEYHASLKKWIYKPSFDGTLRKYLPATVYLDMEVLRATLDKKYVHPGVRTPPKQILAATEDTDRMLANSTPLKKKSFITLTKDQKQEVRKAQVIFYERKLPVLAAIQEAAENALLEFKYAVMDYIKQDGIQPGCLPSKERAILWKVDAYYLKIIQDMKKQQQQAHAFIQANKN